MFGAREKTELTVPIASGLAQDDGPETPMMPRLISLLPFPPPACPGSFSSKPKTETTPLLPLGNVRLEYPGVVVIANIPQAGPVFVYYGNEEAGSPHYDLSLARRELLSAPMSNAPLGAGGKTARRDEAHCRTRSRITLALGRPRPGAGGAPVGRRQNAPRSGRAQSVTIFACAIRTQSVVRGPCLKKSDSPPPSLMKFRPSPAPAARRGGLSKNPGTPSPACILRTSPWTAASTITRR